MFYEIFAARNTNFFLHLLQHNCIYYCTQYVYTFTCVIHHLSRLFHLIYFWVSNHKNESFHIRVTAGSYNLQLTIKNEDFKETPESKIQKLYKNGIESK